MTPDERPGRRKGRALIVVALSVLLVAAVTIFAADPVGERIRTTSDSSPVAIGPERPPLEVEQPTLPFGSEPGDEGSVLDLDEATESSTDSSSDSAVDSTSNPTGESSTVEGSSSSLAANGVAVTGGSPTVRDSGTVGSGATVTAGAGPATTSGVTSSRATPTTAAPVPTVTARPTTVRTGQPILGSPTVVPIVDPRDYGATGDGVADDTTELQRALDAAANMGGGIVFIADGLTYRTSRVVRITGDNVKLWSRSGRGQIFADTVGKEVRQAVICQDNDRCGIYGVRFSSNAARRLTALEDSQVVLDGTTNSEVVGVEIERSPSAAVFIYGRSSRSYIEGNYIHDSWADAVHFTGGSRQAWVWDNTLHNKTPRTGDDGVACVTYGDGPFCGEMEWWRNTHLGSGWGRAFAVVGGEEIEIHNNYAADIAGAGVLVAAEPSYDTPGSRAISIHDNVLLRTGQVVPHSGILVSGLSAAINDVTIANNLVVDSAHGESVRTEGDTGAVAITGTSTSAELLPSPLPRVTGSTGPKRTDVVKIRDRSFVEPNQRRGLYRIHVWRAAGGAGFENRFEYVVGATTATMNSWMNSLDGNTDVVSEVAGSETFAVVTSPVPLVAPSSVREIGFEELRRGDKSGKLDRLWAELNAT